MLLVIFTPLLPCSVLFPNLSVRLSCFVGEVGAEVEGVFKMMKISVVARLPAPRCLHPVQDAASWSSGQMGKLLIPIAR